VTVTIPVADRTAVAVRPRRSDWWGMQTLFPRQWSLRLLHYSLSSKKTNTNHPILLLRVQSNFAVTVNCRLLFTMQWSVQPRWTACRDAQFEVFRLEIFKQIFTN